MSWRGHGHVEQRLGARAFGQVQQQGGDALAGGAAAQHQHVVLAAAQAVGGQLQQPAGDVAALAGQGFEGWARHHAHQGRAQGLGGDAIGRAALQAEHVAGEVEGFDLPPAVAQDPAGAQGSGDQLVDSVGRLALVEDRLALAVAQVQAVQHDRRRLAGDGGGGGLDHGQHGDLPIS
jgi:hypothetical protein